MASLAGVLWYLSIMFYGMGGSFMGVLGASVGWATMQSTAIIAGNVAGLASGEWKGATRYAIRIMPPIAIFTLCWQIALGGQLGPAVATALFALSLPMQGLWWLGKRSVTPLPPSILNWFYEVRGKLQEAGQALAPVDGKPDYQALADTLKRAFKQLDKTFLDDL